MTQIPDRTLNNGLKMPQLGLGVWKVVGKGQVESAIKAAFEVGYRAIDTAAIYGNEAGVGRAIKNADLSREEIFITTKLWNSDQGYDAAKKAFRASLKKLQLDYVDLYLIHWPQGKRSLESWRALEELYKAGLAKAIGVCNFEPVHLEQLIAHAEITPAVNQIELHPQFTQQDTRAYCKEKGIQIESWSPLMQGGQSLQHKILQDLAAKHSKTPAQIVLRWHIQNDLVVIPKSVSPKRICENIDVFDFTLDSEDMKKIAKLETGVRIGPKPGSF